MNRILRCAQHRGIDSLRAIMTVTSHPSRCSSGAFLISQQNGSENTAKTLTIRDLHKIEDWYQEQEDGSKQFLTFAEVREHIKNLEVKQGDVWIVTFPKSGTTWMQELVWLLTHNLDYEGAKTLLKYRSPGLDQLWAPQFFGHPRVPVGEFERCASLSGGRRVLKSHLRLALLPDKARDPNVAKIIYVARNPKDVFVSTFYFYMLYKEFREKNFSMDDVCPHFFQGNVVSGPYWPHIKEFWALRNNPNVLFVKYEEMKQNLEKVVRDVANFLEEPVPSGEQMTKLLDHLSFQSMKKNPALNRVKGESVLINNDTAEKNEFLRKGIIGDWKEKLSPKRIKEFDEWIQENLKDIDITFVESE